MYLDAPRTRLWKKTRRVEGMVNQSYYRLVFAAFSRMATKFEETKHVENA